MKVEIEERNNKLKHYITCLKCQVSGNCCDDDCSTQYEAGNMGEIIKNLEAISKILEQESSEDCISRNEVRNFIRSLTRWYVRSEDGKFNNVGLLYDDVMFGLDKLPTVIAKE